MTSGRDVYLERHNVQSAPRKELRNMSLKQIAQAAVAANKAKDMEFLGETLLAMEIELERIKDRECAERIERDRYRSED